MAINQDIWKEIEGRIILLLNQQIKLMDDMVQNIKSVYPPRKMSLFRILCMGYLLIAKSNAEAAISLVVKNFVHQVHYIGRNMFEMLVILYYIDTDEKNRVDLAKRFFDYHKVNAYKALKVMREYPEIFDKMRTEERDRVIEKDYSEYNIKYGKNLQNWSGKTIPKMIDKITDEDQKRVFLDYYHKIITINNKYLHPTTTYLKEVISTENKIIDYKVRVMHLGAIYIYNDLFIRKYLKTFSKGRIDFNKRLEEIHNAYVSLTSFAEDKGVL